MKWVLRFVVGLVLVGGVSALLVALTRYLHPEWWKRRLVRRVAFGLPVATLAVSTLWLLGVALRVGWVLQIGAFLTAVCLIFMLGLIGALPLSGLVLRGRALIVRWKQRRSKEAPTTDAGAVDPDRRQLIQGAAAIFPAMAVVTGSVGIARSFCDTRVYRRVLRFPSLPTQLEGLRILHLTDIHLGIYKTNDHLADALARARALSPDLVLLTGDIADDLTLLPGALDLTLALKPKHGVYSSLGNHEYSRGIREVKRIYDASAVTLLRDNGVSLNVGGDHPLYLAGCDDPRYGRHNDERFLRRSVKRSLARRPPGAFTILLSHRPQGFVPAAASSVDLTLSGHTHGGQLGIAGRSVWQPLFSDAYLWGHYRSGRSQMYLSAGLGHWFPFRLGCPTEAPVLELRPT